MGSSNQQEIQSKVDIETCSTDDHVNLHVSDDISFDNCKGTRNFDVVAPVGDSITSSVNLYLEWPGLEEFETVSGVVDSAKILVSYVSSRFGDTESHESTGRLYSKLLKLNEIQNRNREEVRISPPDAPEVIELLENLVSHLKQAGYAKFSKDVAGEEFVAKIADRTTLDFIDIVWDLLCNISLEHYSTAFGCLAKEILSGNIKPMVMQIYPD